MTAVLCNRQHPEYGVIAIPFPMPPDDKCYELLEAIEIGDTNAPDCYLQEIKSGIPILKCLTSQYANIDELDYLAKRLDSFDDNEMAQFQGVACTRSISSVKDFINLTFCCQQATVITDFSDLEAIGRNHFFNMHGGMVSSEDLHSADLKKVALNLILNDEAGEITPYGVVYENGLKLEQLYDGRYFPAYIYSDCVMEVAVTCMDDPADTPKVSHLYLPESEKRIGRTLRRGNVDSLEKIRLDVYNLSMSDSAEAIVTKDDSSSIRVLNELAKRYLPLDNDGKNKLDAAILFARPNNTEELLHLADQLELFDWIPGAKTTEDLGRYMILQSGQYEYDEALTPYYDYTGLGEQKLNSEFGEFTEIGYLSYHGCLSIDEVLYGMESERMEAMEM